jgi:hypothetical protein
MDETPRARRRADQGRMKAKVRRIMRSWFRGPERKEDPRHLGVMTSTHGRPCGCFMCQERAREHPQPRERAFYDPEMP